VNGKLRSKVRVPVDTPEEELEVRARADAAVLKHLEGKAFVRAIIVRNKLVNLVVR
jgi:leucyl-tRNA synthetase